MGVLIDVYLGKPYYHGKAIINLKFKEDAITLKTLRERISNKTGLPMKGISVSTEMGIYDDNYVIQGTPHVTFTFNPEYMPENQKIRVVLKRPYGDYTAYDYYRLTNRRRVLTVNKVYNIVSEQLGYPHNLFIFLNGRLLDKNSHKRLSKTDLSPWINLSVVAF